MTQETIAWDADIQRIVDWFLTFLDPKEWHQRKESIEDYLESVHEPSISFPQIDTPKPVSINDDRMGWYLYLAETTLCAAHKYEPSQGARVLPIFKILGENFNSLMKIGGIED